MQLLDSKVEAEKAAREAFESVRKAQQLEEELAATRNKLQAAERVLSKKESEWVPIGDFVDQRTKADKAERSLRALREDVARQRTALKFAKQEKDQRDEELREANKSGFGLHQSVNKLSEDLKSANFQLKHLRTYVHSSTHTHTLSLSLSLYLSPSEGSLVVTRGRNSGRENAAE